MATALPRLVPGVIAQHAEMTAHLYGVRTLLTHAPHVKVHHLLRIDNRLAAHLDALAISGEAGRVLCTQALDNPDPGAMFAIAVATIERQDDAGVARMHALASASADMRGGLIAAFGWVEPGALEGIVARALSSDDPVARLTAVAACALHRVDPGLASGRRIVDANPTVRARSLRTAGELGCRDLAPACEAALREDDPDIQFWAAWSAVLLGSRGVALQSISRAAQVPGTHRARAFRLAVQVMAPKTAHEFLQGLKRLPEHLPWLIRGAGIVGDSTYVPWLIGHMSDERTARSAGEAFSLITGVDLARLDLERKPPESFEPGPNDDPDDPNVEMDPDDGLPWPDAERIKDWWAKNGGRFQPGQRFFMGAPVTREHCVDVLKNGYQRQRILAAHYLCLLEPGTPLFNTSAPAWRQQKLLAQM